VEPLPALGCQAEWQRVEVGLIRGGVVKALVRPAAIVEVEVAADRGTGLADVVIGPQIHLLVFDAAPQPLDEHVVPPSPFAVHADGDAVAGEQAGEGRAGEL
jgi:hypothetical protein